MQWNDSSKQLDSNSSVDELFNESDQELIDNGDIVCDADGTNCTTTLSDIEFDRIRHKKVKENIKLQERIRLVN